MTDRAKLNNRKFIKCLKGIMMALIIALMTASPVMADVTSGSASGSEFASESVTESKSSQAGSSLGDSNSAEGSIDESESGKADTSIAFLRKHEIVIAVPAALIILLLLLCILRSKKNRHKRPDKHAPFDLYDNYMMKFKTYYDLCASEIRAAEKTRAKMEISSTAGSFAAFESLKNEVMRVGESVTELRVRGNMITKNKNARSSRREMENLCDDVEKSVDILVRDLDAIKKEHARMKEILGR